MESNLREEFKKLRQELADDLAFQDVMLRNLAHETDQRFARCGVQFEAVGQETERVSRETRRLARELSRLSRSVGQMSQDMGQLGGELRQLGADSAERFQQMAGRMRLTDQRLSAFLGLVDNDQADLRGLCADLLRRVSALEERNPPAA